jgi:hypothetical protein
MWCVSHRLALGSFAGGTGITGRARDKAFARNAAESGSHGCCRAGVHSGLVLLALVNHVPLPCGTYVYLISSVAPTKYLDLAVVVVLA